MRDSHAPRSAINGEEDQGVTQSSGSRQWWLAAAFLLVGSLCFTAGILSRAWQDVGTLEISVVPPQEDQTASQDRANEGTVAGATTTQAAASAAEPSAPAPCPFVGSKNSDLYHIPTCSYAKRILPENRRCFASAAEAEAAGYRAGCLK